MRILITGGAGFVGSSLAIHFAQQDPSTQITVFDNLRRRGSELNLPRFKQHGIRFVHGDIRYASDFKELVHDFDYLIEASAEPSVNAGIGGDAVDYVLQTNLVGLMNCLEYARHHAPHLIFLSTSRVYSIPQLRQIQLEETPQRFVLAAAQTLPGLSAVGVSEHFSTADWRSLYGTSKLAGELLIQEYVALYGLKAVINRCGVIVGAGQFGKVDQGVFTLWMVNHYYRQALRYTGFNGLGKQVRDLLHPDDLFALLQRQMSWLNHHALGLFNVGGGLACSTSLRELTEICQQITGNQVAIGQEASTNPVDIPWYVADCQKVQGVFNWQPQHSIITIMQDIHHWLRDNDARLRGILLNP